LPQHSEMKKLSEYKKSDIREAMMALLDKKALKTTDPYHFRSIGFASVSDVMSEERRKFIELFKLLEWRLLTEEVNGPTEIITGRMSMGLDLHICHISFIIKKSWMESIVSHHTTIAFSKGITPDVGFNFFVWHGDFHYFIREMEMILHVYHGDLEFNEIKNNS